MTTEDIAERLFSAIEGGDIEAIRQLYAPDAVIWLNVDGVETDVERNLAVLAWASTHIDGMRYEQVRRQVLPSGFVQQHVLRGRAKDGTELSVPACLVVRVEGDRIARIDEYLDRGQLAALLG